MIITRRALATLLATVLLLCPVMAQTQSPTGQCAVPIVTATASSQRVRYVSMGEVNQTRLQVFSSDGTPVFDSDFKLGNLIDWQLTDQQGARLSDGSYLFLVSVKDFSGTLTQKYGTAQIESEQVFLQQTSRDQLSQAQVTALDANKQAEWVSAVDRVGVASGLNRTTTSTDGATAIDTVTTSQKKTTSKAPTSGGNNLTGTGTQNKIAKWTDNAGTTLGDSAITEVGGNVGIGLTNPAAPLHIQGSTETVRQSLSDPNSFIQFAFFEGGIKKGAFGYQGSTSSGFVGGPSAMVFGTLTGSPVAFFTNGAEKVRLDASGNFGIGTATPQARLHVNGTSWFQGDTTPLPNTAGKGIAVGFGGENGYLFAFDYTAFAPKNLLLNHPGGNVGIGTLTPAHRLDIAGGPPWTSNSWSGSIAMNNGAAIGWRANGGGQRFGIGQSTGGLYFFRTASDPGTTASPAIYDMAISDGGNVGIGTISPISKLTVQTATANYGLTHTDGTTTVGSYINAVGGWLGTRSNHKLFFFTGDGGPTMTVDTTGNVGIGTITPTSKLEIAAQDGLKISGFQPFLTLRDTNSGNNSSYMQSANGNLFVRTDAGNIIQPRNNNGLVKAMALIKDDATVGSICYNSQATGAAVNTSPCGIVVTFENTGDYLVDFGFPVTDRFISVTPRTLTDSSTAPIDVTATVGGVSNVNQTKVFLRSSDGARSGFFIFVY